MPVKKPTIRNNRKRPAQKRGASPRHHGPLTHLSIEGFRGIRRLDIDGLAPLTVFTGDNGAGKSTLLEAAFAVYGRTTPAWVPKLQAWRGLGAFSKEGPSYLGLFYDSSEAGSAALAGRAEDGTKLRLQIDRTEAGRQAVVLKQKPGRTGPEPRLEPANLADLAVQISALEFRAYENSRLENQSQLIWTFTPPDRGELQVRGGKPGYPTGMFQQPAGGALGDEDKDRYGDAREAGRDRDVMELVKTVDPRIDDIEYLQTTRTQYFRAKLKDGRTLPLGMLGGGVVNVFRFGIGLAHVGDGFLAIDEVENGFYHRQLPDVFRALVSARSHFGTQLMLATHSDEALSAIIEAATAHDASQFSVVHLRRDEDDNVQATVISGPDAKSSLEHGYDLR
jgi:energy-coupling factor transporter ATP-binding protein EcfA2